jgi:hypothetical protein
MKFMFVSFSKKKNKVTVWWKTHKYQPEGEEEKFVIELALKCRCSGWCGMFVSFFVFSLR